MLGQTAFSVRAVRCSEGIGLGDAILDYFVEDEVVDGLWTLGLDPAEIRYVIISHAPGDHARAKASDSDTSPSRFPYIVTCSGDTLGRNEA